MEYSNAFEPDVVIVEDSNAGYEFFSYVAGSKGWKTVSAEGKSNIFKELGQFTNNKVLVIADGAAFGPEMDRVMKRLSTRRDSILYLPESFEWLILISGVVKDGDISRILDNPSEYIESGKYMSWEQFFTALLVEKTRDSYLKYAKSKLNISYKNETIVQKIIDEIPEGLGFVKYSV